MCMKIERTTNCTPVAAYLLVMIPYGSNPTPVVAYLSVIIPNGSNPTPVVAYSIACFVNIYIYIYIIVTNS
jgi:hypothetical protein